MERIFSAGIRTASYKSCSRFSMYNKSASISILYDLVNSFIRAHSENPILWAHYQTQTEWPTTGTVEVVLIGDAHWHLTRLNHWPSKLNYRFWVLSHQSKKSLNKLFKIPLKKINVIDRYQLFPYQKPTYSFSEASSFLFSGRIVTGKNFDLTKDVIKKLRKKRKFKNFEFFVCGPDMVPQLGEPNILGDLGKDWIDYNFKNPILINLSTYNFEDFSVSVAQAQAAGFPVITSQWYGLKDVGGYSISVPSAWIFNKKAQKIANYIYQQARSPQLKPIKKNKFIISETVSGKNLKKYFSRVDGKTLELVENYFCNMANEFQTQDKKIIATLS